MDNNQELQRVSDDPAEKFISRITVSKVANLGNYENRKIEISVNFSKPEQVGDILAEIESIIDDYNCTKDQDAYALRQAHRYLAKPAGELSEHELNNLDHYRKIIKEAEKLDYRQRAALDKLNQFGGSVENRDAKTKWDDDDFDDDGDY